MPRVTASAARPIFAFSLLLSVLGASLAWSAPMVGSINFTLGGRRLTGDWDSSTALDRAAPLDTLDESVRQPALGVEVTLGPASWPVQIAGDILYCSDDGMQNYPANNLFSIPNVDVRQRTSILELAVGARKAWAFKWLSPYVGGGVSMFRADISSWMIDPAAGRWGETIDAVGERNWAPGFWIGGGVYKPMGPRFHLGITARYSKADMEFTQRGDVIGHQGGYVFVPYTGSDKIQVGGRHIGLVVGWSFPTRK